MCDSHAADDGATRSARATSATYANTSHTLLNEPADIAVDPLPDPVTGTQGSVYIADGYGNHRIVVYTTPTAANLSIQPSMGHGLHDRRRGNQQPELSRRGHSAPPAAAIRIASSSAMTATSMSATVPIAAFRCSIEDLRRAIDDRRHRNRCACRRGSSTSAPMPARPRRPGPSATMPSRMRLRKMPPPFCSLTTRACDMDFWPNVDYLASKSPTSQKHHRRCRSRQRQYLADRQGERDRVRRARLVRDRSRAPGTMRATLHSGIPTTVDFERQHLRRRNDHRATHPEIRADVTARSIRTRRPPLQRPEHEQLVRPLASGRRGRRRC